MAITDPTIQILKKSLDVRMASHRVIAANLANVDTPGYQAHRVDFEATMTNAIAAIDSVGGDPVALALLEEQGTSAFDPIISPTGDPSFGLDGNNVDMDTELGDLGKNSTMYELTSRLLAAKMRQLQMILDQGGQ